MDQGAQKLLESATLETLHAHNFSRSSTQATQVLTDLLARYLTLLSTSCAKYAEHAGRLRLTVRDAVSALDELGVGVDELSEYCATEARDLSRYAVHTARRIEDVNEFKASLATGLKEDHDDMILLEYARVPVIPLYEDEEQSDEEEELELEDHSEFSLTMDLNASEQDLLRERLPNKPPPASPPLPLSPISNPSTPVRKRPRTASWRPPPHVPDFLPPFPSDSPRHSPSPFPQDPSEPVNPVKPERHPSPPPQAQISSSASSADYLTRVPFEQSSLAGVRSWDLPSPCPPSPPPGITSTRLPVPQTQPSLLGAYHHVLTHPPPANVTSVNPARYKVALSFLTQSEVHPRWEPTATLFSSSAPNTPRVAPVGPSYPVPLAKGPPTPPGKSEKEQDSDKDRKPNMPSAPPRPVVPCERLTPLMSQQASRIPKLARQLLPGSVHTRTTRLTHPPVLQRGPQKLLYGPGVNAAWNRSAAGTPAAPPGATKSKDGQGLNGLSNGKDAAPPPQAALPDARLFATWNYEPKRFNEPIATRRGRMASMHGATVMGIPAGRAGSESRVG
ncbi:hypothetical protein B0H21DRAFT_733342 [Amylocystis lapponica]|nr:hypothetical protein B0H21DRAFT_733342 [Amylocystis lapponica]